MIIRSSGTIRSLKLRSDRSNRYNFSNLQITQTSILQTKVKSFSSSNSSSNSNRPTTTSIPNIPRQPNLDFRSIIKNQSVHLKNLRDRKVFLSPRTTDQNSTISEDRASHSDPSSFSLESFKDLIYFYEESQVLKKSLNQARNRQNELSKKIKSITLTSDKNRTKGKSKAGHRLAKESPVIDLLDKDPNESVNVDDSLLLSSEEANLKKSYREEAIELKRSINELLRNLIKLERRLLEAGLKLPNLTHPDVPIGPYSKSRVVLTHSPSSSSSSTTTTTLKAATATELTTRGSENGKKGEGDDLPFYSFEEPFQRAPDPERDHLRIMTSLNWLSFSEGQRSTGPSFPILIDKAAILELVLIQYSISVALRFGYRLKILPELVRFSLSNRCGFAPRDQSSHQTYFVSTEIDKVPDRQTSDKRSIRDEVEEVLEEDLAEEEDLNQLCLSATGEIPMIGSFHSTIFPPPSSSPSSSSSNNFGKDLSSKRNDEDDLNIRLVGLSNCFRSEAGSRGLESRGLYRVHQFKKLELVNIIKSDKVADSENSLRELVELQVEILRGLKVPFRVLEMSSEELGSSAFHKFDIETWMPGRGRWGEVTSASNCTDYQSRRLSIRFKPSNDSKIKKKMTKRREEIKGKGEEDGGVTIVEGVESMKEEEETKILKDEEEEVEDVEEEDLKQKQGSEGSEEEERDLKRSRFVHTLNGTAAAIPRLLITLIENGIVIAKKDVSKSNISNSKHKKFEIEDDDKKEREKEKESFEIVGIKLPVCLKESWERIDPTCNEDGFITWY